MGLKQTHNIISTSHRWPLGFVRSVMLPLYNIDSSTKAHVKVLKSPGGRRKDVTGVVVEKFKETYALILRTHILLQKSELVNPSMEHTAEQLGVSSTGLCPVCPSVQAGHNN